MDKKSAKKGKRGGEEAKEKIVNVKKQKLQTGEAVAAMKKAEAKMVKKKKKDETSSSDVAESESDEEPAKADGSEDSSDGESEDESEEDEPVKTSKKGADVEMADAATPKSKTPATSEGEGAKTLFIGNLPFDVEQSDVEEFFKDVGEAVEVRLAIGPDGSFKGFGHVEFATPEVVQKALELNGSDLLGRQVKLDFARERGAATPKSSFPKAEGNSVFIRGFDKNFGEEEARSALQEHFGACGDITRCSILTDRDSGGIKGLGVKICNPSMAIQVSDRRFESTFISDDESDDESPSVPSIIPPAMLRSRCPVRISFHLAPVSQDGNRIYGYRYTEWHDKMHICYTDHRYEYTYELDTRQVSNSDGETCVVHRLIRLSLEGKSVEISGHCPHDNTLCACNCINDPSFKTAFQNSQSEVVDDYNKLRAARRRWIEAERKVAELESKIAELERGLAERRLSSKLQQ